jgi:hypothetical protein
VNQEFKDTLKTIVDKIGAAVEDAATLTVETWYITIDDEGGATGSAAKADFETRRRPLARTVIQWDTDCISVIPLRKGADSKLEVAENLLTLHNQNVQTARQYRADIINTFLNLIS